MIKAYLLKDNSTKLQVIALYREQLECLEDSMTEVHEGWFVSEDDLKDLALEFWNAGYNHRDSDDLAPPDFTDYWQAKKKEIL